MYKYIVFDLDGTLIDTAEGTVKMFQEGLRYAGIIEDDKVVKSLIGPPFARTLVTKYGLSEEKAKKAIDVSNEYMFDKGVYECKLFDGMRETLEMLKANNIKLSVATSQPEDSALIEAKHVEILDYFDHFIANNLYQTRGSKSDFVGMCIDKMEVSDKSSAIMIGDKKPDIIGGKENGIATMGVLYGYGDLSEIKESNPIHIVKTPIQIKDIILK
ncbi:MULTISPECIES: HAD hydrolase-like protein [Anaerofustis]|uniref:HAD hydrolase-like protein n=1 Tax=Anaerofustis TaxID=264995 RepID=UPI001485805D|nr:MULTISPECIES: HAD hydrolase-like protein [Anaerofustis]MCO8193939.1 HAD hydrolase-like protein [Anaerofustis sp. NSJ-163]